MAKNTEIVRVKHKDRKGADGKPKEIPVVRSTYEKRLKDKGYELVGDGEKTVSPTSGKATERADNK